MTTYAVDPRWEEIKTQYGEHYEDFNYYPGESPAYECCHKDDDELIGADDFPAFETKLRAHASEHHPETDEPSDDEPSPDECRLSS